MFASPSVSLLYYCGQFHFCFCTHIHTYILDIHTCIYINTCIHIYTCAHTTCLHTCIYSYLCIHTNILHACIHTYTYIYIKIYIQIYIQTYTYTYIYNFIFHDKRRLSLKIVTIVETSMDITVIQCNI